MIGLRRASLVTLFVAVAMVVTAHADEAADKAAIMERLHRWTADFNSNDPVGVCDLFAPDLIYSIPEVAQGTRETLCANLAAILTKSDVKLRYANPDVHEIVVARDVAVVRLTWTLTTEATGGKDTTTEEAWICSSGEPMAGGQSPGSSRANKLLR
jgi:ketosteroid isomerase-like protein